jgi:hypothetical protein
MLSPGVRVTYNEALAPPPGYRLETAVGATYSLDLVTLLEAPVLMAKTVAEDRPGQVALLAAIRSLSDKITVYCQQGRIRAVHGAPGSLPILAEPMIVEVDAPPPPQGRKGCFHAKFWLLRLSPDDSGEAEGETFRLVVLTGNLTPGRSWDLSLRLEGRPVAGRAATGAARINRPLSELLKSLPALAVRDVDPERAAQTARLAQDVLKVEWVPPPGFDRLEFFLPGHKRYDWPPPSRGRLVALSPFCSEGALKSIAGPGVEAVALVSDARELDNLPDTALSLFRRRLRLKRRHEDALEEDEADEPDRRGRQAGLHAKAYLYEDGRRTTLVVGSANATDAALSGRNIELLASLSGPTRANGGAGGVEALLGPEGFGSLLEDHARGGSGPILEDPSERRSRIAAEKALEAMRSAGLSLTCRKAGRGLYRLELSGAFAIPEEVTRILVWPVTGSAEEAVDLVSVARRPLALGRFPASLLTGLLAVEIHTSQPDARQRLTLKLPVEGLPVERDGSVNRTIVKSLDDLVVYIRHVLSEGGAWEPPSDPGAIDPAEGADDRDLGAGDPDPAADPDLGTDAADPDNPGRLEKGKRRNLSDPAPGSEPVFEVGTSGLLELMVMAYCRRPERLGECLSMMAGLTAGGLPAPLRDLRDLMLANPPGHPGG